MRIISYSVTNLIPYGRPHTCFGNARDYVDEVGGDMRYAESLVYDLEERGVIVPEQTNPEPEEPRRDPEETS